MTVIDGEGRAFWTFAGGIQSLSPEANKSVAAVGREVDEIAIKRPAWFVVPTVAIIQGDPLFFEDLCLSLKRSDKEFRHMTRALAKHDPMTIGRKIGLPRLRLDQRCSDPS